MGPLGSPRLAEAGDAIDRGPKEHRGRSETPSEPQTPPSLADSMSDGPFWDVYADTSGHYRWRIVAANGRIVASSAEAFDSRRNAWRATAGVARIVGELAKVEPDDVDVEPV